MPVLLGHRVLWRAEYFSPRLRLRKDGMDTIYAGEKDERLSDTPRKIVFGGLVSGLKWRKESNFFFGEEDNFLVVCFGYLSQD